MNIIQIALADLRNGKRGLLIFGAVMFLFVYWMLSMFDPEAFEDLSSVVESYPEEMKAMMNDMIQLTTFGGFTNMYIFSFIWLYIGVYLILKASQAIPGDIETKTIDLIMSKPMKRWEYVLGKQLAQLAALGVVTGFLVLSTAFAVTVSDKVSAADLNIKEFAIAFLLMFLFLAALETTGLFMGSFLDPKKATAMAFGALIFFYAAGTFWKQFAENIQNVKYLSIIFYFNTGSVLIMHDLTNLARNIGVLTIYTIVMTALSVVIYTKRDINV